jgi:glyoxylase-like metal-dependent hydrolase (beta-lactamase superfamily II)
MLPPSEHYQAGEGKGAGAADWVGHRQFLDAEGQVEIELGGFLVRTGDRLLLVDVGIGPNHQVGGQLLDSLRALGVDPAEITDVLFTHLHFDHVGWSAVKDDVVFPNATHRCHRLDWEYFFGTEVHITKKLRPVLDRVELFDGDVTIAPGVDVRLAAGHTPGSVLVVLSSGAARGLLLGDVVHCPVELLDDEWAGMGDVDPKLARATRNALARELEGTDIPVAAAHFPDLTFGRLLFGEGRRQWVVD